MPNRALFSGFLSFLGLSHWFLALLINADRRERGKKDHKAEAESAYQSAVNLHRAARTFLPASSRSCSTSVKAARESWSRTEVYLNPTDQSPNTFEQSRRAKKARSFVRYGTYLSSFANSDVAILIIAERLQRILDFIESDGVDVDGHVVLGHELLGWDLHGSSPHVDLADLVEDGNVPPESGILLSEMFARAEDDASLVGLDDGEEASLLEEEWRASIQR